MIFEKIFEMENLQAAWGRVRANRSGPGIDRVRWEDFEANLSYNLQMLQNQLRDESYKPLPVSVFDERKGAGKSRTIGLSSMRDKVVQQAVLAAMGPCFEKQFLPCSFAYRPGMSALAAVKKAGQCISAGNLWLLQIDVEKFFDTMDHTILLGLIGKVIDEKPLIRLISRLLKARIFREMGLFDNLVGSQQGSGLSPLLSNIYLHPIDTVLWERHKDCYLRYSDDVAVFSDEKEKLEESSNFIQRCLAEMKLSVNRKKTSITHVASGVVYLGYFMDAGGKGPARKSIEGLQTKLADYDKVRKTDNISEKLADITSAIRGWYNYYKTLKPIRPANVLSLIALAQLSKELGEASFSRELLKESKSYTHNHPQISFQLGELFFGFGMNNQAMREYARAIELDPSMNAAKERVRSLQEGEENIHQAIEKVQLLLHHNPHYREGYRKLAEYYSQLGLYGFAEQSHQKALEIDDESGTAETGPSGAYVVEATVGDSFDYHSVDQDVFLGIFAGRRDAHARQWVDERGRWGFARVERPMKAKDVYAHLKGEVTLAVYPVTARDTVHFIVFDVDTAKRLILESGNELLEDFRVRAHQDILRIKAACDRLGLALYIEDSGYKGRHGWLFFTDEVPAVRAIQAGRRIMNEAGGPSEGLIWELFPMGKSERHQSTIKLPLGLNRKNMRRCLFLNPDNHPIADQSLFLKTIVRNDVGIVSSLTEGEWSTSGAADILSGEKVPPLPSPGVEKMVTCCKVINHLVSKARDTNYLNHCERTCLLYTLTFAGEEGCRFLHKVISFCINYDYQYTQRQIERRKESPISCAKIMENFPELAETLPCDCKFKLPPRSYPSPVLYLIESEIEIASAAPAASSERAEAPDAESDAAAAKEEVNKEVPILDFDEIFSSESSQSSESSGLSEVGGPAGNEAVEHARDEQEDAADPGLSVHVDKHFNKPRSEGSLRSTADGRYERAGSDDRSESAPASGHESVEHERMEETVGLEENPVCFAGGDAADIHMELAASDLNEPGGEVGAASKLPTALFGDKPPASPVLRPDNGDPDACELFLEYLKLKHVAERAQGELDAATGRLERFFDGLGGEKLRTSIGSIRRVREKDGKAGWVLVTGQQD